MTQFGIQSFRNTSLVPLFLHPQWRAPRRCGRWGGGCRALRVDWGPKWWCVTLRLRLVGWCRLLYARELCCAGSVPGRRTPAHICAQSLSMLWVCGMEQGWAILQVDHPPAEVSSEPPGRRRVGEKPTRLRVDAWKFRGSSLSGKQTPPHRDNV